MSERPDEQGTKREAISALAELRHVTPPPALVARVMTAVAAPRPWTVGQALSRLLRAELRLSVRTALLLGALTGVAAWMIRTPQDRRASPEVAATAARAQVESAPILVRFVFEDHRAHQVFVAGSFNDWTPIALDREGDQDGARDSLFVATLSLPHGVHEYMFLVDGDWVRDPLASDSRPDGFGRQNSLLRL